MTEHLRTRELDPRKNDRDKVNQIIRSLKAEAADPMGEDPRIAAWCRATIPELGRNGVLDPLMQEIFAFRRVRESKFPSEYAMRLAMRAVQKQALMKVPRGVYPDYASEPAFWRDVVYHGIFDADEFYTDMCLKNNQSNLPDRAKSFDLLTHFYMERLGPSPLVVEVGASDNLILKKWRMKHEFPFTHTVAVNPQPSKYIGSEYTEDDENTARINQLLKMEPVLGLGVAVDIFPVRHDDGEMNMWVKSCSFYPGELMLFQQREQEFDDLSVIPTARQAASQNARRLDRDLPLIEHKKIVQGIEYIENCHIDVRDPNSLAQMKEYLPRKVDLFIFSNILHQMTAPEIKDALDNLRPYCHKNSLVAVDDMARVNVNAPNGLEFIKQSNWVQPYSRRSIVIEPLNPDIPPRELFRWRTPRCNEVWLTSAAEEHLREGVKLF